MSKNVLKKGYQFTTLDMYTYNYYQLGIAMMRGQ